MVNSSAVKSLAKLLINETSAAAYERLQREARVHGQTLESYATRTATNILQSGKLRLQQKAG